MSNFDFDLGDSVFILASSEKGEVIGRAEYNNGAPNNYFLRYKSADGRAVEAWWEENAIGLQE